MTRTLTGWTLVFAFGVVGICRAQDNGTPAAVNGAAGAKPQALNAVVASPSGNGPFVAGPCCNSGCPMSKNFCARLWGWMSYRALPQSADSIRLCNRVPSCSPPVWAFFTHDIEPPVIPAAALQQRQPSVAGDDNGNRENLRD
jgi:hypothetical protein